MKKLLFAFAACFVFLCNADGQQLSQIRFSQGATLSSIAFMTDQGVLIRLSDEGKILEWGIEVKSPRYEFYAPQLQPFTGRIDYYGAEADSISRGRVKSIGTCSITYYGAYEPAEKAGKVRTIGTLMFDYFPQYESATLKGKLKTAGSTGFNYYGPFENEAYKGKLKAVGTNTITYHSSFDDKLIKGKIKSIGTQTFVWYTSLEPGGMGGGLKSGQYRQPVGSVTYILN
jgi:hypothetical protein